MEWLRGQNFLVAYLSQVDFTVMSIVLATYPAFPNWWGCISSDLADFQFSDRWLGMAQLMKRR